jgi:GH24 family phage-related lysozyme (muramidase)
MNIPRLKDMLRRHEGVRRKAYRCTKGHWTIGVRWNLDAHKPHSDIDSYLHIHGEITNEMIERLLDVSVNATLRNCHDTWPRFDTFSENRQIALADFMFNLGVTKEKEFKNTNRAINEGRWEDAARGIQNSLYYRQLGGDPPGTNDGRLERPEEICMMIREG